MSRTCIICGKANITGYKFCSSECRRINIRKRFGIRTRAKYNKGRAIPMSTCRNCGEEYKPKVKDRITFCSRECSFDHKTRVQNAVTMAFKEQQRRVKDCLNKKKCLICGKVDKPRYSTEVYCSDECRMEKARRRSIARDKHDFISRQVKCKECRGTFNTEYGFKRRVFCSDMCIRKENNRYRNKYGRNHKERARYYGVPYEPIVLRKVFERDKWACQICGQKTPKRLRGTINAKAPEIDHIIPLSIGGAHTWNNVQCACRECNISKGATIVGQIGLFARRTTNVY